MYTELKKQLHKEGFALIKNFISKETASEIKEQVFNIFSIQSEYLNKKNKVISDKNELISQFYEKDYKLF